VGSYYDSNEHDFKLLKHVAPAVAVDEGPRDLASELELVTRADLDLSDEQTSPVRAPCRCVCAVGPG
jgi:hypothetical protein